MAHLISTELANCVWGCVPKLRIIFGEIFLCMETWVYWHHIEFTGTILGSLAPYWVYWHHILKYSSDILEQTVWRVGDRGSWHGWPTPYWDTCGISNSRFAAYQTRALRHIKHALCGISNTRFAAHQTRALRHIKHALCGTSNTRFAAHQTRAFL